MAIKIKPKLTHYNDGFGITINMQGQTSSQAVISVSMLNVLTTILKSIQLTFKGKINISIKLLSDGFDLTISLRGLSSSQMINEQNIENFVTDLVESLKDGKINFEESIELFFDVIAIVHK